MISCVVRILKIGRKKIISVEYFENRKWKNFVVELGIGTKTNRRSLWFYDKFIFN